MGLPKIIIGLYIVLTFMVSSCVSHKIWAQQTPHDPQVHHSVHHASPTLPRKLTHHEEAKVKTVGNKHYMPFKMKEEALPPGKLHRVEVEGIDPSQFFGMDYMPVRKRRPIHNTFVPVAP